MKVGVTIPQGWLGEFDGIPMPAAFARAIAVAKHAEELGFDSLWVNDHLTPEEERRDSPLLESFTLLAAIASVTRRVRLGHLVICAGYRSPIINLKMISTLDAASGGRAELGLGAGWKEDDWRDYGYGFPTTRERLDMLQEHLEAAMSLHATDRSPTREGGADTIVVNPRPVQARVPILVGGNGPERTWRLAARYADELNVDGLLPDDLSAALPVIRQRCEEVGRDPATLRVSVHYWYGNAAAPGAERVAHLAAYNSLGVARVMGLIPGTADSDDALERFARDARAAGAELDDRNPSPIATRSMLNNDECDGPPTR